MLFNLKSTRVKAQFTAISVCSIDMKVYSRVRDSRDNRPCLSTPKSHTIYNRKTFDIISSSNFKVLKFQSAKFAKQFKWKTLNIVEKCDVCYMYIPSVNSNILFTVFFMYFYMNIDTAIASLMKLIKMDINIFNLS